MAGHKLFVPSNEIDEALEISLEEEYTPSSALEIPPMADDDQYVYRWIRFRMGNEDDYSNISKRMREGWKFVPMADMPEGFVFPAVGSKIQALEGTAVNGDLVLAKLPRRRAEAILKFVIDQANNAEQAYNLRTISYEDGTGGMVQLANNSTRAFSRGRRPSFG